MICNDFNSSKYLCMNASFALDYLNIINSNKLLIKQQKNIKNSLITRLNFNKIFPFSFRKQLQLAQLSADMSRDEMHGLSGGDSSSGGAASPLQVRLERFAQALANSQEELRR